MSAGDMQQRLVRANPAGAARAALNIIGPVIAIAAMLVSIKLISTAPGGAMDFRTGVWQPAADVLAGRSPYPDASTYSIKDGVPSIYPPFIALLAIPLGALSYGIASVMWATLIVGSLLLTLWVCGVRDWRLFGFAFLLPPVIDALGLGQVEFLLVLAAALVWRFRDSWPAAALALGAGLAIKPLMLPLVVWLLITRRFRAAFGSIAVSLVLALGSWALIGFSGLRSYPALLQAWDRIYGGCGISLGALALKLGSTSAVATALQLAVAGALMLYAWRVARDSEGDRRSFSASMGALVIAAPVVWSHYLVYLIVPLALAAPRLDRRWLLLALPWVFAHETSLAMKLVTVDGRVIPTASFIGTDSYLVFAEYLLLTAAVVLVTLRSSEGSLLPGGGLRRPGSRCTARLS